MTSPWAIWHPSLFANHFLQMALAAGLSASFASGIIGPYVVVKRIVLISGSISHSVLGGLGITLYLKRVWNIDWLHPMYGTLGAALISACLIGWARLSYKEREDTVIAALWAFGMSLGIIFISLTPGYNVEITNYLFGNILWVDRSDIYTLLTLDGVIAVAMLLLHRRFLAICFDEEQAALQKQPVKCLYFLLLSLVAVTVVLLVQIVGAIFVIAILSLPAAMANTHAHTLPKMMALSLCFSGVISILGMSLSFSLNWPPGATISLTATSLYACNLIWKRKGSLPSA